jgi:hypothetical protein
MDLFDLVGGQQWLLWFWLRGGNMMMAATVVGNYWSLVTVGGAFANVCS